MISSNWKENFNDNTKELQYSRIYHITSPDKME